MNYEILIIEDNYDDIYILDHILKDAGYTIRVARDGSNGLRNALYEPPDLILLDVMLPDLSGIEICRQIRDEDKLKHVPVLCVTGLDDVNLKERAFDAGAFDYITKPFNRREILIRIEHQFERAILQKQMDDTIRLQERQHIARELHDSVNQSLFVMGISVQSLMMEADKLPAGLVDELMNLNTLSQGAIAEMRTLLNELRPSQIADTPLPKLIKQLVDAYRLRIHAEVSFAVDVVNLPDDIKLVIYRITQEALNNIAKYAGASHLRVSLLDEDNQYRLVIEDDGCGFDLDSVARGIGLNSMKERAQQHKIDLKIISVPSKGTRIEAVGKYH